MGRPPLAERSPYDRDRVVDVADIARALGVHKSSIYHHVASKEQLLEDAVKRALNALHGVLAEPGATSGTAVERLRYVVERTVEIMVRQLPEVTVLLRIRGNTPTERWAIARRRDFDRAVQRIVAAAIAEGDLRIDIDTALVTRLIFGMSNSVTEWYQPGGRLSARDMAGAIEAIIFEGLRRRG